MDIYTIILSLLLFIPIIILVVIGVTIFLIILDICMYFIENTINDIKKGFKNIEK